MWQYCSCFLVKLGLQLHVDVPKAPKSGTSRQLEYRRGFSPSLSYWSMHTGRSAGVLWATHLHGCRGLTGMNLCVRRREAAQKLSVKGKGVVREQVPPCLMQFCLLTFFCRRQSNPRIVHSGPAWLCMTHRRRLGFEPKMKISEGGESRDENLKALQAAEWQPVHNCFFRCWTGTYYWCFLLGDAHTDKLDVARLLQQECPSPSEVPSLIYGRVLDRIWKNQKTEKQYNTVYYFWSSSVQCSSHSCITNNCSIIRWRQKFWYFLYKCILVNILYRLREMVQRWGFYFMINQRWNLSLHNDFLKNTVCGT